MSSASWPAALHDVPSANSNFATILRQDGHPPVSLTFAPLRVVAIDPRVRLAEAIMYHNLGRTLSLDDLARRTAISVSRLSHLFKMQVGTSPRQYMKFLRLRRAKYLLEISLLSVKEVAGEVGLTSGALIRDFRRAYGASPKRHPMAVRSAGEGPKSVFEAAPQMGAASTAQSAHK